MAVIKGGPGSDSLTGTSSNDIIYGYGGNDILSGRNGNDSLAGGAGFNDYYGGSGADKFAFAANVDEFSYINDFNYSEGDRIVVGRTDQGYFPPGELFIGTGIYSSTGTNNTYDILSGTSLVSGTNFESFDFEGFDTF